MTVLKRARKAQSHAADRCREHRGLAGALAVSDPQRGAQVGVGSELVEAALTRRVGANRGQLVGRADEPDLRPVSRRHWAPPLLSPGIATPRTRV